MGSADCCCKYIGNKFEKGYQQFQKGGQEVHVEQSYTITGSIKFMQILNKGLG